jgi:hypothetical protein
MKKILIPTNRQGPIFYFAPGLKKCGDGPAPVVGSLTCGNISTKSATQMIDFHGKDYGNGAARLHICQAAENFVLDPRRVMNPSRLSSS